MEISGSQSPETLGIAHSIDYIRLRFCQRQECLKQMLKTQTEQVPSGWWVTPHLQHFSFLAAKIGKLRSLLIYEQWLSCWEILPLQKRDEPT